MTTDIQTLLKQHKDILKIVYSIKDSLIEEELEKNASSVRHHLTQLAQPLKNHLHLENNFFYPDLLASDNVFIRTSANCVQDQTGDLEEIFNAFEKQWSQKKIEQTPVVFIVQMEGLIQSLEDRILREEESLFPLLDLPKAA